MTFTGRIRLFLIFIAVLPPLIIMTVIYFSLVKQSESIARQEAHISLMKFIPFQTSLQNDITEGIKQLVAASEFQTEFVQLRANRNGQIDIDPKRYGLDFLEILDSNFIVKGTFHRPGLIGQKIAQITIIDEIFESVEYDLNGAHASLIRISPLTNGYYIYSGKYIDSKIRRRLQQLLGVEILLSYDSGSDSIYNQLEKHTLYQNEDKYTALLAGSKDAEFYLTADFLPGNNIEFSNSILKITAIVAVLAMIFAIISGIYITGKAKKEIENLVLATSRVAGGDFSTPVMAYEEGEFSQLADSFSEMMLRLKVLRQQLTTSEKIAAWQTVGRKIAHEIKNPLSPIAIASDDLRRSYYEKLPEFEKTLNETTTTIKSEITRLSSLLDEFVSFARMKQPEIRKIKIEDFIEQLKQFYKNEINTNRLSIMTDYNNQNYFSFDDELIKQVLINLIKNGFETSDDASVKLKISLSDDAVICLVEDNGPGFTDKKLANSFEPYDTTKQDGSGLGLVICHRIIHDHNGNMELYNKPEGGAGVRITLPQ